MRKTIALFLTLLLSLTAVSAQTAQTPESWVRLAPPGGGFVVMVPGQAEEQISNKDQVFTSKLYTVIVKDGSGGGRAIYLAGVGDYAESIKVDPQAELNANRENFLKELAGMKLLQSRNITLDGRLGIEFTGDSDRATVTCKFYVKGNRVFQLAAMVFKGVDETKNVNKFFDSFAFITAN